MKDEDDVDYHYYVVGGGGGDKTLRGTKYPHLWNFMSLDSSDDIGTRHGMEGSGIEYRWGEIFRTRSDRPWSPSSPL